MVPGVTSHLFQCVVMPHMSLSGQATTLFHRVHLLNPKGLGCNALACRLVFFWTVFFFFCPRFPLARTVPYRFLLITIRFSFLLGNVVLHRLWWVLVSFSLVHYCLLIFDILVLSMELILSVVYGRVCWFPYLVGGPTSSGF